jgi:hypothetical protein
MAAIGMVAASTPGVAQVLLVAVAPATMARLGSVSDRFQSHNVEMLEITGGRFWKPYKEIGKPMAQPAATSGIEAESANTPAGMSRDLYQYRYTLHATELQSTRVELNRRVLQLGRDGALPALTGTRIRAGDVGFEPASITFLALSNASNTLPLVN